MKPKLVVALVILGAVWFGIEPLSAQTTPPTLAGSWQLSLIPGNPNPTVTDPAIHALATFTQDGGMIETDSSEAASISPTAKGAGRASTAGHGIWQPAPVPGTLFIRFIKLIVNPNGTLYARKTITISGALDSTGDNFSGAYSYVIVDPNGGFLGTGSGTVTGQRIPHPPLP